MAFQPASGIRARSPHGVFQTMKVDRMNSMKRHVAAFLMSGCALLQPAFATAQVQDQQVRTASGATAALPPEWSANTSSSSVVILTPPEADTHIAIADVGAARDAAAAVAAAWTAYRPGAVHPQMLMTSLPAVNGWDEQDVINYETSPNEHLVVQAIAKRKGSAWTVVIIDASESTLDKRSAAAATILQSLRPKGVERESFAGRTAHPLDAQRVQELVDFVRTSARQMHVPGVGFALIDHGKIVFEGGIGVKEIGKPDPVDAHTRFLIASNTKSMSTLLLAKLVDEGKLRWDEPVTQAYPAFRLGSEATTQKVLIKHLVCACTGLPRKDMEWAFLNTAATPATVTFEQLAKTEPTSDFGAVFQYNNLMAAAAGYIGGHIVYPGMEIGAAYDKAMQQRVFTPLGMYDTTLSLSKAITGDHATPHGDDIDGNTVPMSPSIDESIEAIRPAGGAWSSAHDLILYVENELTEGVSPSGKRLFSAQNLLERRAPGVPIGESQWYGMGLMLDETWGIPVVHHGGDLAGFHSDIIAIPSAQVGAVILTNGDNGWTVRRPLMRRLLEILYDGRPEASADVTSQAARLEASRVAFRKRLIVPPAPADVALLAPSYANPDLGELRIEKSGTSVTLHTAGFSSPTASRHNDDGTVSFISISPNLKGLDFVVGEKDGQRTLTLRDAQHEYVFIETPWR